MRGLLRSPRTRAERRRRRQLRVRKKIYGSSERPRLVVFRSLKHIYAQLIDDTAGKTVVAVSKNDSGKFRLPLRLAVKGAPPRSGDGSTERVPGMTDTCGCTPLLQAMTMSSVVSG